MNIFKIGNDEKVYEIFKWLLIHGIPPFLCLDELRNNKGWSISSTKELFPDDTLTYRFTFFEVEKNLKVKVTRSGGTRNLEPVSQQWNVSQHIEAAPSERRFFHFEILPDGSWSIKYPRNLIPELSTIGSFEISY